MHIYLLNLIPPTGYHIDGHTFERQYKETQSVFRM